MVRGNFFASQSFYHVRRSWTKYFSNSWGLGLSLEGLSLLRALLVAQNAYRTFVSETTSPQQSYFFLKISRKEAINYWNCTFKIDLISSILLFSITKTSHLWYNIPVFQKFSLKWKIYESINSSKIHVTIVQPLNQIYILFDADVALFYKQINENIYFFFLRTCPDSFVITGRSFTVLILLTPFTCPQFVSLSREKNWLWSF